MASKACTSVIVPVLNGRSFIVDALKSVTDQLEPADEILVIDDGSTDNTRDILQGCDPRVKLLAGPGRGPSAARNVGLAVASGDFIAFLDHDDIWPAGRHQALLSRLTGDASVDAAAGRIRILVEAGCEGSVYLPLHGKHEPEILMTCLYRRGLIDRVGNFDETLRFCEDLDFHLRLGEIGMNVALCDCDSLVYRRHATNATNNRPPRNSVMIELAARRLARVRRGSKATTSPG
jgi:glycosyltransferase involved in cell wall biosynthesis